MLLVQKRFLKEMYCMLSTSFAVCVFAQTPALQVVTELSPPDQFMLDGEVAGLATTKVREILRKANISASFSMYPWARAQYKALNEPNTLIYSIAKTEQRDASFYWLAPVSHYTFGWVSLSDRNDINIDSIDTAKQYRLVVQREDISHYWLMEHGFVEDQHFITCSDIGCSWQLLLNKNVDLIIETPEFIDGMLSLFDKPSGTAKYIGAIPDLQITGYLAANKKIDPELLAKLKLAISNP